MASVESRWLREASAVQQHGALCAIRGIGLSDHVVLAKAVVMHQEGESNGDGSETKEEPPLIDERTSVLAVALAIQAAIPSLIIMQYKAQL